MIEITGLIVLLVVSVVVLIGGWVFSKRYCLTAVEYLSKHPKLNFIIHIFTGLGSGWLIGLWMPKTLALVLGAILLVGATIMRYVIPQAKLPWRLRSIGMHMVLPVGLGIALLSYPWLPKTLTLILGAISIVGAEIMHYVFPNLVVKRGGLNEKT